MAAVRAAGIVRREVLRRQLWMPVGIAPVDRLAADTDAAVHQATLAPAHVERHVDAVEELLRFAEALVLRELDDVARAARDVAIVEAAHLLPTVGAEARIGWRGDAVL